MREADGSTGSGASAGPASRRREGIQVWDLALGIPVADDGGLERPVVRALKARVSAGTLATLLARGGAEGRLVPGGVEATVRVQGVQVTVHLMASVPGNGRLRLEATDLRLGGWLPVPVRLVDLAMGRIASRPGLHRAGPRAVDVDLGGLLAPAPVYWRTGVSAARVTREFVEIECSDTG